MEGHVKRGEAKISSSPFKYLFSNGEKLCDFAPELNRVTPNHYVFFCVFDGGTDFSLIRFTFRPAETLGLNFDNFYLFHPSLHRP